MNSAQQKLALIAGCIIFWLLVALAFSGCAATEPAQWRQDYMIRQAEGAGYEPTRLGRGADAATSWWGADGRWRFDNLEGTRILGQGIIEEEK